MNLAAAISFGTGLLMVVACWFMIGQPRPLVRWLAMPQAVLLTWPALKELPYLPWVLAALLLVPLTVKPRPHVQLGRFCLSIMAGMLLAGIVTAL